MRWRQTRGLISLCRVFSTTNAKKNPQLVTIINTSTQAPTVCQPDTVMVPCATTAFLESICLLWAKWWTCIWSQRWLDADWTAVTIIDSEREREREREMSNANMATNNLYSFWCCNSEEVDILHTRITATDLGSRSCINRYIPVRVNYSIKGVT